MKNIFAKKIQTNYSPTFEMETSDTPNEIDDPLDKNLEEPWRGRKD
jgi:hypothetical protein